MHKILILTALISSVFMIGCENQSTGIITCSGAVKEGSIWITISASNKVLIGKLEFTKERLSQKYQLLEQSCESVSIFIRADESAKNRVVFDIMETVKRMGYNVEQ